ncbi:MAG: family 78 glycoside hydrolase catalytic domain [Verrucomicrobiota bacterium]
MGLPKVAIVVLVATTMARVVLAQPVPPAAEWGGTRPLAVHNVTGLRCEFRVNPLGIDASQPRLSWVIESKDRDVAQTAYQVVVEGVWDSGKVASAQSQNIEYGGKPLVSGTHYDWKVRVWDNAGKVSPWSEPARWTMGLLKPENWTAHWISTEMDEQLVLPKTGGNLKILKATYAARDGTGSSNVTEKISSLAKDGVLNFKVASSLLGVDSAMNYLKNLEVEYELNGNRGTASAIESEQMVIPPPPASQPKPLDEPYVRREFDLAAIPTSALATVNVMGFYELYVNGKKVGPNVMGPALSDYQKRSLYETYDLAPYLRKGRNCIGLWLSRGWYLKYKIDRKPNPSVQHNTAIARLQLDMIVAGHPLRIVTDGEWRCKSSGRSLLGPWLWNKMGGELVDARQDDPRWSDPEATNGDWYPVKEISAPAIPADAQKCPPMRVLKTIRAISCTKLADGKYQLDFGTELTGWLKLRVPGKAAGDTITIQYADKLDRLQTYNQMDRFICAGKPGEEFCSKFNYHGFRWAIIEGLAAAPELADAEAQSIGADFETRGDFECSSEMLNHMHKVNLWTIRCLSQGGYLSDCPHRERLGYGDGQVSIESCMMNFMMQPFYDKWSTDWCDGADPDTGYIPHTAPQGIGGGGPAWGGAAEALTWRNYLYYQDTSILTRNIEACRRHIAAIEGHAKDGIVRNLGGPWGFIGDWVAPGRGMDTNNRPPPNAAALFNNCYLIYLREQWAQMADVLGRHDEAKVCRAESEHLRPLIHAAFYDKGKQRYALDEQSYYLMPLMTGVVPEELRPVFLKKLEECIRSTRKGHLDTGMLGTYFLMNYLMEIGRNDLLWLVVTQKDYPGWGFMIDQGATTWWEQWNGYWSQIHSCFTSLDGWFFQGVAGIRPDESEPGFKKIIIKPAVVGDLTRVKCYHDSPYGRIVSNWNLEGQKLTMEVIIPANTTATVHVPATDAGSVSESGKPAAKDAGVKFLRIENGAAVYAVGSGTYRFESRMFSTQGK